MSRIYYGLQTSLVVISVFDGPPVGLSSLSAHKNIALDQPEGSHHFLNAELQPNIDAKSFQYVSVCDEKSELYELILYTVL